MVTSVSSPSPPASTAFSNDITVFSGASYRHTHKHYVSITRCWQWSWWLKYPHNQFQSHHGGSSVSDEFRGRSQCSCLFDAGWVHPQRNQVESEQHGQVETQDSHLTYWDNPTTQRCRDEHWFKYLFLSYYKMLAFLLNPGFTKSYCWWIQISSWLQEDEAKCISLFICCVFLTMFYFILKKEI